MARVLVDSSVWIDFWRRGRSVESRALEKLAQHGQVCLSDIILRHLEIPIGFWNGVARARFRLTRKGLQVSISDVSIALIARHYGCLLLTSDRPLIQVAKALSVNVYTF